jgi:hypothetical protein
MKHLTIIILSIFLFGCSSDDSVTIPKEEYNKLKNVNVPKPEYPKPLLKPVTGEGFYPEINDLEIVLMDSCEYIIGNDASGYNGGIYLTHRARCKFCEQRKNS